MFLFFLIGFLVGYHKKCRKPNVFRKKTTEVVTWFETKIHRIKKREIAHFHAKGCYRNDGYHKKRIIIILIIFLKTTSIGDLTEAGNNTRFLRAVHRFTFLCCVCVIFFYIILSSFCFLCPMVVCVSLSSKSWLHLVLVFSNVNLIYIWRCRKDNVDVVFICSILQVCCWLLQLPYFTGNVTFYGSQNSLVVI